MLGDANMSLSFTGAICVAILVREDFAIIALGPRYFVGSHGYSAVKEILQVSVLGNSDSMFYNAHFPSLWG